MHAHDYIEWLRGTLYPPLHVVLEFFDFYATGSVPEKEYVGTAQRGEEALEEVFHDIEVPRNGLAKYKSHSEDGRESTGSWRLTHRSHENFIDHGMQLHLTLLPPRTESVDDKVDIYAHYEDDYEATISGHLSGRNYSAEEGVRLATELFRDRTDVTLTDEHGGA